MKRGNINGIIIVVTVSFILILLGSLFNIFSITGNVSECAKVPLKLFNCPEGYSLAPIYDSDGCIYKYQEC